MTDDEAVPVGFSMTTTGAEVLLSWLDERLGRRIYARRLDADGRALSDASQVATDVAAETIDSAWHGGGMVTHITSMILIPSERVGFFASVNAQSGAPRQLMQLFLEFWLMVVPAAAVTVHWSTAVFVKVRLSDVDAPWVSNAAGRVGNG